MGLIFFIFRQFIYDPFISAWSISVGRKTWKWSRNLTEKSLWIYMAVQVGPSEALVLNREPGTAWFEEWLRFLSSIPQTTCLRNGKRIHTEVHCTYGSVQFSRSVILTLCDPMDCSMPGFPVHHQLPEFTQTHVHWVGDAIQPSHPLSSPFPPAFNLSQHQGLFQWVSSSHLVAKVLGLQLQHQSFQWIFRDAFL